MRISDWSSDVCSSDLEQVAHAIRFEPQRAIQRAGRHVLEIVGAVVPGRAVHLGCAGWLQRAEEFVVVVFGAVEHQMFEQVREAVQAGRLVLAADVIPDVDRDHRRSEEHTSELQSLMRISYAVFCLKKKKNINNENF